MIGVLAFLAAETVDPLSTPWWQETLSWIIRLGAVAGAAAGIWKFPLIQRWWKARQERIRQERESEHIRLNKPLHDQLIKAERTIEARHRINQDEIREVSSSLKQLVAETRRTRDEVRSVSAHLDRHEDAEIERRKEDMAQVFGLIQTIGGWRREDVQALRDRRTDDQHET